MAVGDEQHGAHCTVPTVLPLGVGQPQGQIQERAEMDRLRLHPHYLGGALGLCKSSPTPTCRVRHGDRVGPDYAWP